jgi:hypothetical protein
LREKEKEKEDDRYMEIDCD